jgi:hypothetical protein
VNELRVRDAVIASSGGVSGIVRLDTRAMTGSTNLLRAHGQNRAALLLFDQLASEWKEGTEFSSSLSEIVLHPAYQRIIGLGSVALPLILRELKRQPDHWFWALRAITGQDPVPVSAYGDLKAMAHAWTEWAVRNGVN